MKNLIKIIVFGLSILHVLGRIAVIKNTNGSPSKAGPGVQINEAYKPQFAASYDYWSDTIIYSWNLNFSDPKNEKGKRSILILCQRSHVKCSRLKM